MMMLSEFMHRGRDVLHWLHDHAIDKQIEEREEERDEREQKKARHKHEKPGRNGSAHHVHGVRQKPIQYQPQNVENPADEAKDDSKRTDEKDRQQSPYTHTDMVAPTY